MDTLKIIILFVFLLFSNFVFSSNYNFIGSLSSTPGGVVANPSSSPLSVQAGRIRSSPQFTFGVADGKQVGFTADRLSNISTSRIGSAVSKLARFAGPVGMGVTAALLVCDLSDICDDGNGDFVNSADPALYPPTSPGSYNGFPSGNAACAALFTSALAEIAVNPRHDGIVLCLADRISDGVTFGFGAAGLNPGVCATGYDSDGSGGCVLVDAPTTPVTDQDWDDAAPLLNDDAFAQPLIDAGQDVPVDTTDSMAPQNFVTSSETTTLRDDQGNITGTQVTEKRVDITDVSDSNSPNSFDITEKKTVTNFDINNNVVNSETTIINNEQPAETPPDDLIEFDEVDPEVLETLEVTAPLDTTSWGGGSCPAPIAIATSFGAHEFNTQPFCDFATSVKPFILIVAGILAALIVMRARAR